jgi:ParB-like chromosome segregation protein Spo0J
VTGPSTFDMYAAYARKDPAKGRRSQRSITETLQRANIHPIERARLTDALAGLAAGLAEHPTCERCGRSAEHLTNGLGSTCARIAS